MFAIKTINTLKDFIESDEYVIRKVVESSSHSVRFNLIGRFQVFECCSDDPEIVGYVLSI